MRQDWTKSPPQIRGEILDKLRSLGPYSAAMHAMACGYAVNDVSAWCPAHTEYDRLVAEGDQAAANLIKNHDIANWHQEQLAIELVAARRDWAKYTSIDDDRAAVRMDMEKQRAEERERYAVARANEMRAAEEAKAHELRLEMARAEFDRQHPPANGATTSSKKEARS